jgi:hypothetical protein
MVDVRLWTIISSWATQNLSSKPAKPDLCRPPRPEQAQKENQKDDKQDEHGQNSGR